MLIMECCKCSKYTEMANNTKSVLSSVRLAAFSAEVTLRSMEEKSIRTAHPLDASLKNCCQFERDQLIELEVELYISVCKLEAYKAILSRRDLNTIAARRNAALEAYKLKYEAEMLERGESRQQIVEVAEGFDEVDSK